MTDEPPAPPSGLSESAAALWRDHLAYLALEDQEPTPSELRLLTDAVRSASRVDALEALIEAEGATVPLPRGGTKPNPLLADVDRTRRTTALLLKQLGQADRATSSRANGASRWSR